MIPKEKTLSALAHQNQSSYSTELQPNNALFSSSPSKFLTRNNSNRASSSPFTKDVGDSFNSAQDLGRFTARKRVKRAGRVDRTDPDFYVFRINRPATLLLEFTNTEQRDETILGTFLTGQRKVARASGSRLFREFEAGDRTDLIAQNLRPGVYYLRLTTLGGNVDFEFVLTALTGG